MSSTTTQTSEARTLRYSALGCFLIGCAGLSIAALSGSKAILLDGVFNLSFAVVGVLTLRVARLVQRGDDQRFPLGYGFFEPLMNGAKGMLILGLSLLALFDALMALASGGREIAAGFAVGYGVFASAACWSLAVFSARGARQSGSPLVVADAMNWRVNALISSAVLLTFLAIPVLRGTSYAHFVPYVDPALVLIVVLISLAVPVRMAWSSLMELLNRAPDPVIVEQVRSAVQRVLAPLPVQELFVRVIQPGRTRFVSAYVVLPADDEAHKLDFFDAFREAASCAVRELHANTTIDLIFSAERKWGAPLSEDACSGLDYS